MVDYIDFRRPYLVIGYDCEMSEDVNVELKSLQIISQAHLDHQVPFTLFILGELLENDVFCTCLNSLLRGKFFAKSVDIGQHSYSHTEFKRIKPEGSPLTISEIEEEIKTTNRLISNRFGIKCEGIRPPQGYYRGLQGNDAILKVLHSEQFIYISSDLRNNQEKFPSDWKDEEGNYRLPYYYDKRKYPKLLEIPTHGWNDNALKGLSKTSNVRRYSLEEELNLYKSYVDFAILNTLVYAPLFHTWAIGMTDPQGFVIRNLFQYADSEGVKIHNYRQLYEIAGNSK